MFLVRNLTKVIVFQRIVFKITGVVLTVFLVSILRWHSIYLPNTSLNTEKTALESGPPRLSFQLSSVSVPTHSVTREQVLTSGTILNKNFSPTVSNSMTFLPTQTCRNLDFALSHTKHFCSGVKGVLTHTYSCDGRCLSVLCNVCIQQGSIKLLGGSPLKSDFAWACNEGGSRKEVPVSSIEVHGDVNITKNVTLHVLYCWDYYGYHLWICLAAIFALGDLNLGEEVHYALYSVVGMNSASRYGSWSSWDDMMNSDKSLQKNVYWKLWSVVAKHPSFVRPLNRLRDQCFEKALIGSPDPGTVTSKQWQALSWAVTDTFKVARANRNLICNYYNVTIVERKKNYHILNLKEVSATLKMVFGEKGADIRVVILEELSAGDQIRTIAQSQVLVGLHGNGLTWTAVLPPGAALIEIWPRNPYNGNYPRFARLSDVFYAKVGHGGQGKGRFDTYVNPLLLRDAAESVLAHLHLTACEGKKLSHSEVSGDDKGKEGEALRTMLTRLRDTQWRRYNIAKRNARYAMVLTLGGYKAAAIASYKYLRILPTESRATDLDALHASCLSLHKNDGSQKARCLGAVEILRFVRQIGMDPTLAEVTAPDKEAEERAALKKYQAEKQSEYFKTNPQAERWWKEHNN